MPSSPLHAPLVAWYSRAARDLPWRAPGRTPWGVLVSEVMLQQTQVARVVPKWEAWLEEFPTLDALAAAPLEPVLRATFDRAKPVFDAIVAGVVKADAQAVLLIGSAGTRRNHDTMYGCTDGR